MRRSASGRWGVREGTLLTATPRLTALVLAFPSLESTTVYVLTVAVITQLLDREWAPYIDGQTSIFAHGLNTQVLLAPMNYCFCPSAVPAKLE